MQTQNLTPKRKAPESWHVPDFQTRIQGIPCGVVVTHYTPGSPMQITGWGFGDALPPEDPECEWFLTDRKGYEAPWLERKLTREDRKTIDREVFDNAGE